MIKNILFISIIVSIFTGCFSSSGEEKWTIYIYPDKDNTKRTLIAPVKFPTYEICKKEAELFLEEKGLVTKGSYKCGKNCKFHDGMKLDICEEWR